MTETDLSDWLLVQDAADRIGVSTRTVERLKRDGKLEARLRRQEGTPPVAVYNPDDVERARLTRHRAPTPFVLDAVRESTHGNGHGRGLSPQPRATVTPVGDDLVRQFFVLAVQALQSPPSPTAVPSVSVMAVSPAERAAQYVTLQEAVVIKRLTRTYLQRQCESGVLKGKALKDGRRWKIKRTDLETL